MSGPEAWTIGRLIEWTHEFFAGKGIDSPRLDAELLLSEALGCSRVQLYTQWDKPLAENEREPFRAMVKRRGAREPLAYILGRREFFSREFAVSPAVLVPRPETEHLIEASLRWVEESGLESPRILDLGTGSGNIGITIACELPSARLTACDVSGPALEIAGRNAATHGVSDRVELREGDLFAAVAGCDPFDLIVTNPPYVEDPCPEPLMPEVVDHEPGLALFAGPQGLDAIARIARGLGDFLDPRGGFACEFGHTQAEAVQGLLEGVGPWGSVHTFCDLQGHTRGVLASR